LIKGLAFGLCAMKICNVNDGSTNAPRLTLYGNAWGLLELPQRPSKQTWAFEVVLDKIREAGFEGMQADASSASVVRKHGLRFAASGRVNSPLDTDDVINHAADVGADAVTLHVGWGMETDAEMDAYAQSVLEAAQAHHMPVFIETHRATMVQDIYRTHCLLQRWPDLRFNGDFSHYYCGAEMTYQGFDITRSYLLPILQRVGFFHGRVSNAECIQVDAVDAGDGQTNAHGRDFLWMWETGATFWLKQAHQGDILPFAPELGPPSSGYSLTYVRNGELAELSDRWAQTLVLARLAQQAFENAAMISRGTVPSP